MTRVRTTRAVGNASVEVRYWPWDGHESRIASHIKPQQNGCWYWDGLQSKRGKYRIGNKLWVSYRLVWCMFKQEPIDVGTDIHHLCGNAGCVNPDHLEPMSSAEHRKHHMLDAALRRPDRSVETARRARVRRLQANRSAAG